MICEALSPKLKKRGGEAGKGRAGKERGREEKGNMTGW